MKNDGFPTREERWALWQEAFGDSEEELSLFEGHAFSSARFAYRREDGTLAAALYFFDCTCRGKRIAYLYAIATAKAYRGRGLCRALMAQVHTRLAAAGYAGALLVPAEESLFAFYEKLGYRTVCALDERTVRAADAPAPLCELTAEEYAARRRARLPEGGVVQEGENLSYLATNARFFAGEDFIFVTREEEDGVTVLEFLGNAARAGEALCALGYEAGTIRTAGKEKPFAMYFPLSDAPDPEYFAFAFD